MKSFCLVALIATASAINVSDVGRKSLDPWVHEYLHDAVDAVPLTRKDAPAPNTYPPYANGNPYWPEKEMTQTEKDLKAIAIKKMDEEDAAAAAAKPAPPAAPKANKAPTEEEQAATTAAENDKKAKQTKKEKDGAGAP